MTTPLLPGPPMPGNADDYASAQLFQGQLPQLPTYFGTNFRAQAWQSPSGKRLWLLQAINVRGGFSTVAAIDDSGAMYLANPVLPALVAAESVAVSSNAGAVAKPPLLIRNVQVTAVGGGGGSLGPYAIIAKGQAPGVGQVAVDDAANTLKFNSGDKVTTALVTYLAIGATNFQNQGWSPP